MKIEGKNIVITGASSGIGRCLTELLANYAGVRIVAVARRIELIPQKEGVVYPLAMDVASPAGIDQLFDFAYKTLGHVDIFIANAGFAYAERLDEPDWEHISDIFSLNVFSPIYSLQSLVKKEPKRMVQFVSILSAVTYFPLPAYSLYCSTKSALKQFFDTYHYEKKNNLILSNVYPIATRTNFFRDAKNNGLSLPWLQQDANTVAKRIIKGIERNKRSIYPSLLFRLFLPVVRAFPVFSHLYSLNEKRNAAPLISTKK